MSGPGVQRVINATGMVLDDHLGGAPLSAGAREALLDAAGYATVPDVAAAAAAAADAEAAHVVTSASAALLLAVHALAHGADVVVARSDLPRLGDGARVHDLVAAAGASLVDAGASTGATLADLRAAVTPGTAAILTVAAPPAPPAERPPLGDIAALARELGRPLVHVVDRGPLRRAGALDLDVSAADAVEAGADLVVVAGDGLVGGPVAGLLLGSAAAVTACARSALAPALALDPLRRAALLATLASHGRAAPPLDLPVVAMCHADAVHLEARAGWVAGQLDGRATAVRTQVAIGGPTYPVRRDSWAVAIPVAEPQAVVDALTAGTPAVAAGVDDGAVVVDLLTVPPVLDAELAAALADALATV